MRVFVFMFDSCVVVYVHQIYVIFIHRIKYAKKSQEKLMNGV